MGLLRLRSAVQMVEVLDPRRAPALAAPAYVWLWHGTRTFEHCATTPSFPAQHFNEID